MTAFLDTSMVVRYLTGDPPEMAAQAAAIIDSDLELEVTDVVLAETGYVLSSVYRIPRDIVVDHLVTFVQKRNVRPFRLDKGTVVLALLLCRPSHRVSFADALIWAAARSSNDGIVYSLDDRFPSDGIKVRRVPPEAT